jgi:hypothetical protein
LVTSSSMSLGERWKVEREHFTIHVVVAAKGRTNLGILCIPEYGVIIGAATVFDVFPLSQLDLAAFIKYKQQLTVWPIGGTRCILMNRANP